MRGRRYLPIHTLIRRSASAQNQISLIRHPWEVANMPSRQPEEAKGFKLLGHDRSAAWGGGSIVEVHKGYAYVGAVGGASYNGPEGFTAHDVRDPRNPKKVYEFRAPPGIHCHKVRVVGDHHLYVNSERLVGDKGKNARAGLFIFD